MVDWILICFFQEEIIFNILIELLNASHIPLTFIWYNPTTNSIKTQSKDCEQWIESY